MSKATIAVDAQLLQLLNDRICQTIDALHQVRWSAIQNQKLGYTPYAQSSFGYGVSPMMGATPWSQPVTPAPFYHNHNSFGPYRSEIPATGMGFGPYRNEFTGTTATMGNVYGTPVYNAAPVAGAPVSMGF